MKLKDLFQQAKDNKKMAKQEKLFGIGKEEKLKGWKVSNRDYKRTLITFVRDDGKVSITFSKTGWVAADPTKKYDTIDSSQDKNPDIQKVLKKFSK